MRWWLLVVLLVLPIAYSAGIDNSLTTAIMRTDDVYINSQYVIVSEGVEDLSVQIPKDVLSVKADMDDKERTCKIENGTAYCGSTKADKHVFTIEYTTQELLADLDNRKVFKYDEELPFESEKHSFVLKLPVGSVIPKEPETEFFLNPKTDQVLSDGQRIIVKWVATDVNGISVSAVTEPLQRNWPVLGWIIAGVALASAGATWYALKRKKKKKTKKVKKKVKKLIPQFMEDEQKVVDIIKKAANNEIWQKQLLKEAEFSKSKLSRIIRNLEQRGVVTKTIYGNTNKISLKK